MLFSVIIPVYNRPDELRELLESLTLQSYRNFEVLVIDDGSELKSDRIAADFSGSLQLRYFYKENSGQGYSRNMGFDLASGDYFVVFDSDCLVPPEYFSVVKKFLEERTADFWGGPDRAHSSFSSVQKAISFSMTSFLTTGGIRGSEGGTAGEYHPRSFNMGISREVYQKTGGYRITRMGEDIEFSIRILKSGFRAAYIKDAYVYHKRRTSLTEFFRQIHFFGRARVNIYRYWPDQLKPIHFLPLFYLIIPLFSLLLLPLTAVPLKSVLFLYGIYNFAILLEALRLQKNPVISLLSLLAVNIQHSAYGTGLLREFWKEIQNDV